MTHFKPLKGGNMTGCCEESLEGVPGGERRRASLGWDGRAGGVPGGDRCEPGWGCQNEQVNLYHQRLMLMLLTDEFLPLVTRKAPLHELLRYAPSVVRVVHKAPGGPRERGGHFTLEAVGTSEQPARGRARTVPAHLGLCCGQGGRGSFLPPGSRGEEQDRTPLLQSSASGNQAGALGPLSSGAGLPGELGLRKTFKSVGTLKASAIR